MSDGEMVFLKRIENSVHPYEREIAQYFSTGTVSRDSRNHCVPVYDVLKPSEDTDEIIMVMPLLRSFYDPPFYTVGEVVDFLKQVFEVNSGALLSYKHTMTESGCVSELRVSISCMNTLLPIGESCQPLRGSLLICFQGTVHF